MEQSPLSLTVLQGENCTLQCNYSVRPFNNLRWYKQDTGRGPFTLTVMNFSESKISNGRYTAILDETAKHSSLHIAASQLSDTSSYICVVGAPCSPGTCCQHLNLHLEICQGGLGGGGAGTLYFMLYTSSQAIWYSSQT